MSIMISDIRMDRNLSYVRRRGQRASNAMRAFMAFFTARFAETDRAARV